VLWTLSLDGNSSAARKSPGPPRVVRFRSDCNIVCLDMCLEIKIEFV
jgi:hypothetical protein